MNLRRKRPIPVWKPDFQDASLIDASKANFILGSADQHLDETIKVSDSLRKTAQNLTVYLTGAVSAVAGYLLLKCDIAQHVCKESPNSFTPALILLFGYFVAALFVIGGCLMPRHFKFRGNEPKNLLCADVCRDSIDLIKVRTAVGMQSDIVHNRNVNSEIAWCLTVAYALALLVPLVSFLSALWR